LDYAFASIAEELVSGAVLKKMLNHSVAGNVTLAHYMHTIGYVNLPAVVSCILNAVYIAIISGPCA